MYGGQRAACTFRSCQVLFFDFILSEETGWGAEGVFEETNTKIDLSEWKSLKVPYVEDKDLGSFSFSSENSLVYSVMEKIIQEMYIKHS